ncbi:unnamed protein product [Mytilus coruscus]|uniref:MRC n=1 Tax=Mytilus coruscus TaxID=42192 RepID=A0A6J8DG05_MYTCO|nr:unnamed protein product [Mytilus coruscus]
MENLNQTNKIVDRNSIGTFKTESIRKCAFHCLQNFACMAYFYRQNTTECRLMSVNTPGNNGKWKDDLGWRYYNVYESTCPPMNGFNQNRNASLCYRYFDNPKTVYEADIICRHNGGQLLRVQSQEQQTHLMTYLDFYKENLVYIQGNDSVKEGTWSFDDGQLMRYFNWSPTTPFGHDAKDHLAMNKASSYGWEETDGSTLGGFLCERNI